MSDIDPIRDPVLAALLRQSDQAEAPTQSEFDFLADRIRERAASAPASAEWLTWTAGWARTAIPIGVAAGLIAALLLAWDPHGFPSVPEITRRTSFIEAVRSDETRSRYLDEMLGRPDEGVLGMVIER
jgi:hypothetical protein